MVVPVSRQRKPYVMVQHYDDIGDPTDGNNYRPELIMGDIILIPDFHENNGCVSESKANAMAKRIGKKLGIEVKLIE